MWLTFEVVWNYTIKLTKKVEKLSNFKRCDYLSRATENTGIMVIKIYNDTGAERKNNGTSKLWHFLSILDIQDPIKVMKLFLTVLPYFYCLVVGKKSFHIIFVLKQK